MSLLCGMNDSKAGISAVGREGDTRDKNLAENWSLAFQALAALQQ
jgi:hypothetical protein